MKTYTFSITRQYEIKCRLYEPDCQSIKHVIVGVHGFAGDKESWVLQRLASEFSKYGVALICFDFPAHGESPVGENMLTVSNCKNDLYAVLDFVSNKYPDANRSIFATSFGGYIALLCVNESMNFPLVLRAPAVSMPLVLLENVLKITDEQFKQGRTVQCGFERLINLPYSFYEELLQQENLKNKAFSQPITIIHGDCDDIVPLKDVRSFAEGKDISLQIISGADHRFKNDGEVEKIIALTKQFLGV